MKDYTDFDPIKERSEQTPDDWQFGGLSQPGLANIPLHERESYLPPGQLQYGRNDFMSCATLSPINALEAQFTWLYEHGMTQENKTWLELKGYVDASGDVQFSDRFSSTLAGTTTSGNSMKAPLEAIRKHGLIPKKLLNASKDMTFAQYHDKSAITKAMYDLGLEFTHRFTINYEQVHRDHLLEALKGDYIGVAGHGWSQPKNGVYPRTAATINHAFLLYKPKYEAFDNYLEKPEDYTKTLAPDYLFFETAYRVFISAEKSYATQVSLFEKLLSLLVQIFAIKSQPMPEPTPEPKPVPKEALLNAFAMAIQKHEGWYPGSRSYRNKNPGNLVFVGQPGARKENDGRFAVFSTYEEGYAALKRMILNGASGKSKVYFPSDNIFDFFNKYAPPSDNNDSIRYSQVVAKAMGVNPATVRLKVWV
jgi:hypothetical protein